MTTVTAIALAAAVAGVVALVRHPPPTMGRATRRRLTRELNRGRLPVDEPDRSLAERLARSRAASVWSVPMLLGLAASQWLLTRSVDDVDPRFSYALVVLLLVAAGSNLLDVVRSRRVLRGLGGGSSWRPVGSSR